ncbi:MAG TPA: hypothetical protein VGM25_10985, partial [Caulobacteraceae bacterium]
EIGMGLARKVQSEAEQSDTVSAELVLTFSRIARTVRQAVALEARLADDRLARRRKAESEDRAARFARGYDRKAVVKDIVERVIDAADGHDTERLLDDLDERLDDPSDAADFADRPLGELVAAICRDLGVTLDWSLFEDEDWGIGDPSPPPSPSGWPAPSTPATPYHPGSRIAAVRDP